MNNQNPYSAIASAFGGSAPRPSRPASPHAPGSAMDNIAQFLAGGAGGGRPRGVPLQDAHNRPQIHQTPQPHPAMVNQAGGLAGFGGKPKKPSVRDSLAAAMATGAGRK